MLGQEVFADDYRGATVVFRGEFRTGDGPGRAGLFLRVNEGRSIRGPMTDDAVFADPDNNIVTIAGDRDWTSHEVRRGSPRTPTPSCSASSWPATAGSSCATPS